MGGGHYGPDSWNQSAVSTGLEIDSPKFMTLFLSRFARSYESHFLNFFLKFLKNWYSKIFGVLERVAKIENLKKIAVFGIKLYFFLLNVNCTCSQLFFEVYNISVAKKFEISIFLAWKISFSIFAIRRPGTSKIYYKWGCFWCLWKAKDQNIYLKASFDTCCILIGFRTYSNYPGHNGPPMRWRHSRAHVE